MWKSFVVDPYGNSDTVLFSFVDPDLVCHLKRKECQIEYPHLISECGCFQQRRINSKLKVYGKQDKS